LISVEEAWKRIAETVPVMGTECVALSDMPGRVLADYVFSPLDLPLFTNSAVDGYAIRSQDSGPNAKLKIVAAIAAGDGSQIELQEGECARIFTGSPIPMDADAVVMQEDVTATEHQITLAETIKAGNCIRFRGEESSVGQLTFLRGTLISPPVLGVLAELGITETSVYKQPRIAIVGTGNELVNPGDDLRPGQIYESNTVAIANASELSGACVVHATSVQDEPKAIENALANALASADVVITCGGVSVGEHDLIRATCERLGVQEMFWRVAMRPGKPFYFGMSPQGQPVFGLPGNPVSALVTFFVLVRPALRKMIGLENEESWQRARLAFPYRKQKGRAEFVRLYEQDGPELTVIPVDKQGSHMLTGLADAQYLGYLHEDGERYEQDDFIEVKKLTWGLI